MPKKILVLIALGLMTVSPLAFAAQEAPPPAATTKPLPLRQLRFFALGPRTGHVATHMKQLTLPVKTATPPAHLPAGAAPAAAAAAPATSAAPLTQEQAKQVLSIFPDDQ